MDQQVTIKSHERPDRPVLRASGTAAAIRETAPGKHIGSVSTTELQLFYQPQVARLDNRVISVEALLRRKHPREGWLGPWEVLDLLHEPDELLALDWWVLERACRDARAWPGLGVSVNICAPHFAQAGFAEEAIARIDASGLARDHVELELVENAYTRDFERAAANIAILRKAGIKIALDDFGTGYSSLTHLMNLTIDKVKIDKSLIRDVHLMRSAAIVQSIVALSRSLGMRVTAEGVETQEQHKTLRTSGCHFLQGFLFSYPVCADDITALIADSRGMANMPAGANVADQRS